MSPRLSAGLVLGAFALASFGVRAEIPVCDWPMYGRDLGRSFAAPESCSAITVLNAVTLAPRWHVPTGSPVTASPSVVDGTVYVGSNAGTLYALDAGTGEERWTFDVTDGNSVGFGKIISSVAVADVAGTRVVVLPGGATIYLLDASSGALLAGLCTDPRDPADASITRCGGSDADIEIQSSPAVVDVAGETWIVVGTDVHNRGEVGRTGVLAIRVKAEPSWALEPVWKFDPETRLSYTTDGDKAGVEGFVIAADPITYGHGTGDGCGGVWSSPAVDVAAGGVYFGTASCSADGVTSGESMWGIDLASGAFRWTYNPRVDHQESTRLDDDFGASPNLLPDGMVGEGSKDGFYYGLRRDRESLDAIQDGEWESHPGQAGHAGEDFAIGGVIGTSAVGEVAGEPAVFLTTAISTPFGESPERPDGTLAEDPGRMLSIHAISARDGRILWRSPLSRQSYGAPTYANGVLFVPSTVDFAINVFDADTGVLLRRVPLEGAPSSAPAIVGDSLYIGSGTSVDPFPLDDLSGIWAFRVTT